MTQFEMIENLLEFKNKNKFSINLWEERGLNPSDNSICETMQSHLNDLTDSIIELLIKNATKNEIKKLIQQTLKKLEHLELDTEEKEFICEYYIEICIFLKIKITKDINNFIYGEELTKLFNGLKKDIVLETILKHCEKCNTELITEVLEKADYVPDFSWDIVKCLKCDYINMIDKGPGIRQLRFKNYSVVKYLEKSNYTKEQATEILNQIRINGSH